MQSAIGCINLLAMAYQWYTNGILPQDSKMHMSQWMLHFLMQCTPCMLESGIMASWGMEFVTVPYLNVTGPCKRSMNADTLVVVGQVVGIDVTILCE
jgi:hypothetical protein